MTNTFTTTFIKKFGFDWEEKRGRELYNLFELEGYGENGIQNCVTSQHRSGVNYGERNTQLRENV